MKLLCVIVARIALVMLSFSMGVDGGGSYKYIGCYVDGSTRTIDNPRAEVLSNLTIEMCLDICYSKGSKFAGLEIGTECFCGDSDLCRNGGITADENCSHECSGNSSQICGGLWRLSMYELQIDLTKEPEMFTKANSTNVNPLAVLVARTELECALYCLGHYLCVGFKFLVSNQTCSIYPKDCLSTVNDGTTMYQRG